jgi:hypothetical protein
LVELSVIVSGGISIIFFSPESLDEAVSMLSSFLSSGSSDTPKIEANVSTIVGDCGCC